MIRSGPMTDSNLLEELKHALEHGDVQPAEVHQVLQDISSSQLIADSESANRFSRVLYYLGGAVVFLGLVFLLIQMWDSFATSMRILVTLGFGFGTYISGVLLTRQHRMGEASNAFFMISALMMPSGLVVAYWEFDIELSPEVISLEISSLLSLMYVISYLLFRVNVLLVASILFGTWLFFALTDYLPGEAPLYDSYEFTNYRLLATGLSFMALGHAFRGTSREILTGWLYGFGVVAFLGSALALGKWKPEQNLTWEIVYPGLVFGVLMLSVQFRSRVYLTFASLFLGVYLCKITAEYFPDSLGWPLAMVILGFLLMGIAWLAVSLSRRYLSG